jgi:osmoprotectant transport system permease protein
MGSLSDRARASAGAGVAVGARASDDVGRSADALTEANARLPADARPPPVAPAAARTPADARSSTVAPGTAGSKAAPRLDRLSAALGLLLLAALTLPFFTWRPNRIAAGAPRSLIDALGPTGALAVLAGAAGLVLTLLLCRRAGIRAALVAAALLGAFTALGIGAQALAGAPSARVSPGPGFWLALASLALLLIDALARLQPGPRLKLALIAAGLLTAWALLQSGLLADLSLAAEYRNRAASFWREGARHLTLAFGSFLVAIAAGFPLALLLHRSPRVRGGAVSLLTLVQTIPSIALFGMLIVPLGWIAAHVPGAAAAGVRGIGLAPAFVALVLYSLLPIVVSALAGLDAVPRDVAEAADGMGLTPRQRRWRVDVPLALPAILAGMRIVLVQNIGLATVGALIGAGGFGTFVFQGLGQAAADLILLGALPVVALAFVTSALMDVAIALLPGARA